MRNRVWMRLSSALVVMAMVAGCSSNNQEVVQPQAEKKETQQGGSTVGGTLVQTTIGDAKILIPILIADAPSDTVAGYVYDSLLTFDEKLNYLPSLALSYKVDQDKIYTFELRNDVKWHDGVKFTAKDVLFTFQAILHPKYTGVRGGDYTGIKGVRELKERYESIETELTETKITEAKADELMEKAWAEWKKSGGLQAVGDYTVTVELGEPFAPFLTTMGFMGIIPAHLLESKVGATMKDAPEARKPVGTGQYTFVEWVKDDHVTLQRNPDWKWGPMGKSANIEKVIIKVVPDSQANMVALETGQTDISSIDADSVDHFKQNVKQIQVAEYMSFSYTYLGYNLKNPMFADKNVRIALTHAINREEIVQSLLKGHGTVANSHGSPARWDYNPNVPQLAFDLAKAEQLLDAAGWRKGPDGIREKGGQKFSFKLVTNNGNKIREQVAVITQQALKKVGIEVQVELMEWGAFLDLVNSDKKEAYILGWSIGFDPDAYVIWHSKGAFNRMHNYQNPRVDQLLEQGRTATSQSKRKEIYGELQRVLAEDQPYAFLFFNNAIGGYNQRIQGMMFDRLGAVGPEWHFEQWYLTGARAQ